MKKRVITALILVLVALPIFYIGGNLFKAAFFLLSLQALREFITVREKKKEFPNIIKLIAYVCLTLFYFSVSIESNLMINFDFRIITALLLVLFFPIILYNDKNKYNINDCCYMLGGVLLIASAMALANFYRSISLRLIVYLFMVTILTDTFALFTGMLIGRHKLLESVSPKKTWEGFIGGAIVATFTSTVFYLTVIDTNASFPVIMLFTLFLSIIGQFGDLFFSSIKRYYKVKDFSNLMPGHGGVLDRLDSIIFVLLAFSLFINLI